jgi:hypothetical protein
LFHVGISQQTTSVELGWEGLFVTITDPQGQTSTLDEITTDSTGGTGVQYIPTAIGEYQVQSHYPEQTVTVTPFFGGTPYEETYLASDSEVVTFVVQEDPIPYYLGHVLLTEYWTRPINAQFYEWQRFLEIG